MNEEELRKEARRATRLLKGKAVAKVWRRSEAELGIEFTDGARLIVDQSAGGVELSITVSAEEEKLRSWPRRGLTRGST